MENNDLVEKVPVPKDLNQLLKNIHFAFDDGLFLKESFFEDRILQHYFGGAKIQWRMPKDDPARRWVYVSDFGGMLPNVRVGENVFSGIDLSVERTVLPNGAIDGHIAVSFMGKNKELYFTDVVEIFGKNWREAMHPIPLHGPNFRIPTDQYGNKRIDYKWNGHNVEMSCTFDFHEDGTLSELSCLEKGKNYG